MKTNVTLESLNLSDNDIVDSGAELIGDFLKTNTGLKILYLSGCLIEHEGERHLGEALRVNSVLTSLDLTSNLFGSSRTIANALLSNTTLIDLNMEDTECGDLGAIAFASALTMNTTLKSLSPQSNDIRFRGARALASRRAQEECRPHAHGLDRQ
jgi:Ran GTPase-activating protein (RanGAP) involved in mRNA processing and transport